jgi:cobalt-zinc-cadmium efflux system outer membrane protein
VAAIVLAVSAAPAAAQSSLSLPEALARARDVSPLGAAAAARVEAASAALGHAGASPNPSIELRSENWARGARDAGLSPDTFAVVSQTIELGGKRGARRAVAAASLEAARSVADLSVRAIDRTVSHLYLEAFRADRQRQALAAQAGDLAELVRIVDRRVEVGTAPEADRLKLLTDQARAAVDLSRAAVAADRSRLALAALLQMEVAAATLQLPLVTPAGGDEAEAVERRADVVASVRSVELARQRLRAAEAGGVPDAHVQGGMKRTAGINAGVAAVGIALPVFGRNRQDRALAAGDLTAAERELAAVRQHARGELAAMRAAAAALAAQARDIRQRLVAPAHAARAATRAAFASGASDILRLLDAERVATDAERLAIDIEVDAVLAAIEARQAAGEDPLP